MSNDNKLVWSDEEGDLRKKKSEAKEQSVDDSTVELLIKRLTTGKGRTVIEITGLPNNKSWCKKLAKDLKKSLGVGGAYKNDFIEVHGEKLEDVKSFLSKKSLSFKQIGG
ncbi:MAG: stress response translation initiation inhibitor YciH [Halobacteriovorax sp.]|nr:stress response translation initiation inhibitor YciH [Halobacteriovorax sp.]|tara:strand:- start:260115 stop:260444 length:330 start_codon:yes stop_codon:yes gene_type:complete